MTSKETDMVPGADSGLNRRESLLMNVQEKLILQDAKLDGFAKMERRLIDRLDEEKEYLRDRLHASMILIIERLDKLDQHHQRSDQQSGNVRDATARHVQHISTDHQLKSAETATVSEGMNNNVAFEGKLIEIQEHLSKQMTSGFDMLREETIQELEKEKQQMREEKNFMMTQLSKAMGDILGRLPDKQANANPISVSDPFSFDLESTVKPDYDELMKAVETTREEIKTELGTLQGTVVKELHRNVMEASYDLINMIEKEAQLTRESSRWTGVEYRPKYEFYFNIKRFKQRVGSGTDVFSCPWYIAQFDSCLKGSVDFNADGTIGIWLLYGRYPKVVGLTPKKKKQFKYKIMLVDMDDETKQKTLKDDTDVNFDETSQSAGYGSQGYEVGNYSCAELQQEGFVEGDTLVLKYEITAVNK
ncbi:uncharacterized protein LOC101850387 [Aplysia californica]|uniref:Uncharacterized protein LOC101850387 n=1 Tax=Aplysia californica TaxID=6500 RepID=A0ABM0KAG6_APLCA|nr:uncharacterized protein LOC101850387 [Aplysia californica]